MLYYIMLYYIIILCRVLRCPPSERAARHRKVAESLRMARQYDMIGYNII